jgi:hypothetical protein
VSCDKLSSREWVVLPESVFISGMGQHHGKAEYLNPCAVLPCKGDGTHVNLCLFGRGQLLHRLIAAQTALTRNGMLFPQPGDITAHSTLGDHRRSLVLLIEPVVNLGTGQIRVLFQPGEDLLLVAGSRTVSHVPVEVLKRIGVISRCHIPVPFDGPEVDLQLVSSPGF